MLFTVYASTIIRGPYDTFTTRILCKLQCRFRKEGEKMCAMSCVLDLPNMSASSRAAQTHTHMASATLKRRMLPLSGLTPLPPRHSRSIAAYCTISHTHTEKNYKTHSHSPEQSNLADKLTRKQQNQLKKFKNLIYVQNENPQKVKVTSS